METYDIVCIGGGLGGLAAAVRAHDLGARVLVLERSTMIGGVAAYSGGFCWVGANHLDPSGTDSIEKTEEYLDYVQGQGRPVDRAARREYLEAAARATAWFAEAGVPLTLIRDAPDLYDPCPGSTEQGRLIECAIHGHELGEWRAHLRPSVYYRTGVTRDEIYHELAGDVGARLELAAKRRDEDFLTHGIGLVAGFAREALVRRGVDCRLDHRVTALRTEAGRVTGVTAKGPDGLVEIAASRGVLIAVGGYGNSPDAAELEDVPELIEAAPPVVSGDGLTLAQAVGATVARGADPFVVLGAQFEDQRHPGSDEPLYTQLLEYLGFPHSMIVNRDGQRLLEYLGFPHSMIVNRDGQRFGDESYYGALIRGLRQFDTRKKRWANHPCWLILDEDFRLNYPLGPYAPGDAYPADVRRFDTLEELAETVGISPDGLAATVRSYNEFAERGEDLDFGRGSMPFARRAYGDPRYENPNLGPVARAPFYALPLSVLGVGLSSMGLSIDGRARVLRRDRSAIEGLYATGNAAATRELKGYVTGLANARNYTYAFAAVNHMMGAD
jgi:glycine/D-amino acid oxidase-like deaminating enzyme